MKDLTIDAGRDSLGVRCDAATGSVAFVGSSFPEDAFAFFEPVSRWIESYLATGPASLELVCRIDYLNSSSSKCLFDLLDLIARKSGESCATLVVWRFDADDEDAKKVGEEFSEDVEIPFVFEAIG